jgi:hypothetical protein
MVRSDFGLAGTILARTDIFQIQEKKRIQADSNDK